MGGGLKWAVAAVIAMGPSVAQAQTTDAAQTFAAGMEEVGQSVGQAAFAGPSVFVTAKGRTKLPAPLADSYFVTVEGKDGSAVVAAHERDAKIAQLMAAARRSGVDIEQGETSISLEIDTQAQQRANLARLKTQGGPPTPFIPDLTPPPKQFVAKASLRFRAPAGGDVAAFLDLVHAAGVDDIMRGLGPTSPFVPRGAEMFGFGSVDSLGDNVWAAASADALRQARAQAQAIAAASGRALGPIRSVIVLSRAVEGGEAVEGVAARFDWSDTAR